MTTHSFSSLKKFSDCGYRYQQVNILKTFKDKPFDKANEGTRVHKAFEDYVTSGVPLPADLMQFQGEMNMIDALTGKRLAEHKMALDAQGNPCEFFDRGAMLRGTWDFIHILGDQATIIDWKHGADKYPDTEQLELGALHVFKRYPNVTKVTGALVYVTAKTIHTAHYDAKDFMSLWTRWIGKVNREEKARVTGEYPKNPSGLCRAYCPVEACEFQGEAVRR
jgi:hypothetical protein